MVAMGIQRTRKPSVFARVVRGGLVFLFSLTLVGGGLFLLWASTLTLPAVDIISAQRRAQSTKIFDRTGEVLLYDMQQDVRKTEVALEDMSLFVQKATIAIEDDGFYNHFGIEPLSILRAVFANLQQGDLLGGQGGSTITQQVVKNVLLVQEKTLSRKLKEWVLAVKMEREFSKDEILEMYLNEAPYGGTKYGVEEASQAFFGKSAKELTLVESAYLAALPQRPSYYSPYGEHREALDARKNFALERMRSLGYITNEEYDAAVNEVVSFRPLTSGSIKAPHFVFYVIGELEQMYPDINISQANLKVITSLDWELQKEAERIVYEQAHANSETFNARNASLMAVDPRTGEVLVMVGSRDYFDDEIDGNYNIGLAKRQPGSSFKPFAYAAALEKGYTTETVVYDVRTQFSTSCDRTNLTSDDGCYSPSNYDNKFRGPMTFRNALAQSVNVPAVKALYLAGEKETIDLARRMGLTTLGDWRRYGLTLVLGGGEVSLLEMTGAYATFAREGYRYPQTSVREVWDTSGKQIFAYVPHGEQVLEPEIARSITNVLIDNNARTPAFGSNSYLYFEGREVAAKTGTTNDYRDAWIIGYTPTISVGAWAGNNNNEAMEKKVAGFIIAPMWNAFLQEYFKLYPEKTTFTKPQPIDPDIKPVLRGILLGSVSTGSSTSSGVLFPHSILHYVLKDDPRGPEPFNPAQDPQYKNWEYGVLLWRFAQGVFSTGDVEGDEAPISDTIEVVISEPEQKDVFKANETVRVVYEVDSEKPLLAVHAFFNGGGVGTTHTSSGEFLFTPGELGVEKGTKVVEVVAYDSTGARNKATVRIVIEPINE